MHDDGWATDSYAGPGPLGTRPEVDTAWYGLEECATLAFDRHERTGRAVRRPPRSDAARARPRHAAARDAGDLPDRPDVEGKRAWENLCAGAYFYLDPHDRAVVATTDRRILEFATSDASGRRRRSGGARRFDVSDEVPGDDCLVALMPDWAGPDLVRHRRTGGSARSTRRPGEVQVPRPRRGGRQLARGRRAGRLRRHGRARCTGCRPTAPASRGSTGARRTTAATRAEARPALPRQRHHPDGAARRPGGDHRQRRPADERGLLRRRRPAGRSAGAPVFERRTRARPRTRWSRWATASSWRTTTATPAPRARSSGGPHARHRPRRPRR